MIDDDPDVSRVPGSMSRRWMELVADELDGDRAAALRFLADRSNADRVSEQSLRLRGLQLFITTATVAEPWPASSWLAQGSFWFLNAGLLAPATMLDLIELQASVAPLLLPEGDVFGVVAEPDDENEFAASHVIAAYRVGTDDPFSNVGRRTAIDRLQRWLAGEPLDSLEGAVGDVGGFTNKTARYGRIRDNFDW